MSNIITLYSSLAVSLREKREQEQKGSISKGTTKAMRGKKKTK